ncbi:hypothetical protein P9443_19090 [Peribacillus frigoritolerans]|uniref:hypothetical protein n=1 Tax=Peribacillus frigoritolerans TaxID=450367 RepID=UPI002E1FB64E|nr:hypothetical protein [Peribacillus frigoritolerans]
MANKQIVWIQSIGSTNFEHPSDSALPYQSRRWVNVKDAYFTKVETYEDVIADVFIAKGYAIPFIGWDTNPKRPPVIRFPQ